MRFLFVIVALVGVYGLCKGCSPCYPRVTGPFGEEGCCKKGGSCGVGGTDLPGDCPGYTSVTCTACNLKNTGHGDVKAANILFDGGNFENANLAGADFSGATFQHVSLKGTNFTGAKFIGAFFDEGSDDGNQSRLDGANFTNADLSNAHFEGAWFDSNTIFTGATLTGLHLSPKNDGLACKKLSSILKFSKTNYAYCACDFSKTAVWQPCFDACKGVASIQEADLCTHQMIGCTAANFIDPNNLTTCGICAKKVSEVGASRRDDWCSGFTVNIVNDYSKEGKPISDLTFSADQRKTMALLCPVEGIQNPADCYKALSQDKKALLYKPSVAG